jgi:hypothetical protein
MTQRITEWSPRFKARLAGALYFIGGTLGGFAEVFVRGRLVVHDDAAATTANILAHESLYRLGGTADIISLACDTAVALLFYDLFKPTSRSLSLLAAFFRLTWVASMALNSLNYFAPMVLLGGAHYLTAFKPDQLQAMAYTSLRLHAQGYNIGLVFFGITCLLLGYLIFRSTFLPRVLGVLIAIAGLCYVINSFTNFLAPAFARSLFPWILLPAFPGEFGLMLWLVVFGVNARRWKAQAEGIERSNSGQADPAGAEPAKRLAMRLPLFL